jgi:carboxymethylenebutenolidase
MRPSRVTGILLVVNWVLMTSAAWAAEGKVVSYRSGDETVSAMLYTPPGNGPFPALIAIHAIGGLDDWVKQQASRLADSGYIALAVDLYRGKVASGSDDRMPEAREIVRNVPAVRRERDLQAAFQFLLTRPDVIKDHIGAIGWCMGGSSAIRLASLEPALKVAVAHYPTSVPKDSASLSKINAAVLLVLGAKDTIFPLESGHSLEQQMKSLGKKVVTVVYQDAGHAFEMPWSSQGYRPDDSADAWKRTVDFLDANLRSDKSVSDAEQEVRELEEQVETLQRANSAERTALWAEDLVYINNEGAVFDKARLAPAVSAGEVKIESLEVTERKIRVYDDVAIVTAKEDMRASFHGKAPRDFVQRYTRAWARRGGKWQVVSFEATKVTDTRPQTAGLEACAAHEGPWGTAGSVEQMIVRLEDEHSEAAIKGDSAKGSGWLGDDYTGRADAAGNRVFH